MRRLVLLAAIATTAFAQVPTGAYHFVDLRLTQDATATTLIGSLQWQGGQASYSAQLAEGSNAAQTAGGQLEWTAVDSLSASLSGLANGEPLRTRLGQSGLLLGVGAATNGTHELMFAFPKPAAAPLLSGRYSGVYLRFSGGQTAAAETSQIVFNAAGNTIPSIAIVSHSAAGDGLNRAVTQPPMPVELAADGTGVLHFASAGPIAGDMAIAVSANGTLIAGTSVTGSTRDLLIVVRDAGSSTEDALMGTYWLGELGGESPYAATGGLRLSSAEGSLFSLGTGTATIAERVRQSNQTVDLTTSARYRLGDAERYFSNTLRPGLRNFAVASDFSVLLASWTGRPGELTLEHGLLIGIAAPALTLAPLNAGSSAPLTAPVAPGQIVSLYGQSFTSQQAAAQAYPLPTDLGGVRLTINNVPAGLYLASPGQINFQVPYEARPGAATLNLITTGGSQTMALQVAAQSPGVFTVNQSGTGAAIATHANYDLVTPAHPARPNETILVFVTGLGDVTPNSASATAAGSNPLHRVTDPSLQVLFNGVSGAVSFAGLSPGFAGLYQINVTVPDSPAVEGDVALGIRSAGAYSDLTDVIIGR